MEKLTKKATWRLIESFLVEHDAPQLLIDIALHEINSCYKSPTAQERKIMADSEIAATITPFLSTTPMTSSELYRVLQDNNITINAGAMCRVIEKLSYVNKTYERRFKNNVYTHPRCYSIDN